MPFTRKTFWRYIVSDGRRRHSYGSISGGLIRIYGEAENEEAITNIFHNMETVLQDLEQRREIIVAEKEAAGKVKKQSKQEYAWTYNNVVKLADHVSLEQIRITKVYSKQRRLATEAKKQYDDAKMLSEDAKDQYKQAHDEAVALRGEASSLKTEVVTILSVFAAIILAFTGGLSILGNAMSVLPNLRIYKALLVVFVCIWGLFNSVFLLLYVAARLTGRSLYTNCSKGGRVELDGTCNCGGKYKCGLVRRFVRRLPYVFWFNTVILLMIAAIALFWVWAFITGRV